MLEQLGQQGFGFGQRLFAGLPGPGLKSLALAAPFVPQSRDAAGDRLEAADDLLFATQQTQELRVIVGLDEPELVLG